MLRPEKMSKVSVTGSKTVMVDVIETVHDLNLLHIVEYDGRWDGFDPGTSIEGADALSKKLVTVRSMESILGVDREDAGPRRLVDDDELDETIEGARQKVNALDDRRTELRGELRELTERINSMKPFAALDIDLDLLRGYDSLQVVVGAGRPDELAIALEEAAGIDRFETFTDDGVVAIFAVPSNTASDDPVGDALVGLEFVEFEVPDAEGSPKMYIRELEHRKQRINARLAGVESELEELKLEVASFLLAVEEELTIDVQKAEAPLTFATTEHSFVAEGWIPSADYPELESTLATIVGDHVDVEELERMDFSGHSEPGSSADSGAGTPTATDGGSESTSLHGDNPPVVLDNPGPAKPFELLVNLVSRPKYTELDPTLLVFLTFPFAFGFMIGDIGYGILYLLLGAFLYRFDSEAMKALGAIALWAGAFTIMFGYLYDDTFGIHMADLGIDLPLAGVLSKGLQTTEFALLWIVVSILFGLLHLNTGFVMGFVNELHHGLRTAILEKGSWILALNGFFIWVFSTQEAGSLGFAYDLTATDAKPEFLVGTDSVLYEFFSFAGFSEPIGIAGLTVFAIGVVLVGIGEGGVGLAELPAYALGHALSYLRITAVLLAKGGMAFVVNILVFGGYANEEGYVIFNLPGTDVAGLEQQFIGLIHVDPWIVAIPLAILVFVFGHIMVLLLGITAAGIQMVRLEWVEFFQKFYEGGGEEYNPFGHERSFTTESG